MTKHAFLVTSGVFAVASVLAATPAMAKDDETIASEAQGTFTGFHSSYDIASVEAQKLEVSFDQATYVRESRGYTGVPVDPDQQLLVRTDIGTTNSIDFGNTVPSSVQIFRASNVTGNVFFNCTGTLINPRTVLTAAHCVNSASSEAYGLPGTAPSTMLISTGVYSGTRLFNTLDFGVGYSDGGVALSTDVVIHPSSNLDNGGLEFPYADVAFIALDAPITDTPSAPILLTPLDQLTHMVVNGYGTYGTGDTGEQGIGLYRRVGENMLGAIASQSDLIDAVFPAYTPSAQTLGIETQSLYWIDFDSPDRTPADEAGCTFTGTNISCINLAAVKAIDWFDGDALAQEAGTAPGDSGSALIADEIADFPLVVGVLSGGYDFFGLGGLYSDISFYNPLFPFFEFITENTPYKYVSALGGDGNWSDPTHWTQDLDPGFYISDGQGGFVNGIPGGQELGVYETLPKLGTILGQDVSANSTTPSPYLPPFGTPGFGPFLPESSVLLGPGSTGFVPNNTDGTPGVAFANPAQYFDVLLMADGKTTVDMDVEVDRLTIDGNGTRFDLSEGFDFTSIIGVEQYRGRSTIDGNLYAGNVLLFGGDMEGAGSITTDGLYNIAGTLLPGGKNEAGALVVNGNYIQTSDGLLVIDIRSAKKAIANDLLTVNGGASLDGGLLLNTSVRGRLSYGDQFLVLTADEILGSFSAVMTQSNSAVLYFDQIVDDTTVTVEVKANKIANLVGPNSSLGSLGATLDALRFGGRYAEFSSLFSVVDGSDYSQFGATLAGLTPTSGFGQGATAINFARRFTGQIAQRTLALRGGDRSSAGFSSYGAANFAQAGSAPTQASKIGVFGSVSGSFLDQSKDDYSRGDKAFEDMTFSEAGELTVGADYHLSDKVRFGVAISNVRDGSSSMDLQSPQSNQSVSGAVYSTFRFGEGFADLYAGYADQDYGVSRSSTGLLVNEFSNASARTSGQQSFAGMRLGYAFTPAKGLSVGPVAAIDYVRSELDGFREIGANEFSLNVHDRSLTSIGAKVGAMASFDTKLGMTGKLKTFGSVAFASELGDREDVVTANFVGAEDLPFSIARELDSSWIALNAGAEIALTNRFSGTLGISSDLGRGALSNDQANLTLRWAF
ncbi:Outer membrane stress sensor protease DegS [Altererythrobacter epoxidivorans]|uniref:Outer membrane stress sensor protease DegS n=1 Tax=Altererythrobacter epoxidivorans TaxID=361183 RepID=A0A0M4MWT2_9SPHN|nr:autotransporter domain-containing protein [Altererythrobacter epoxidivorans]ALE17275.1 Outer membrane stress sensor protease DegS [Altererythrobacter epoxidivorans]